MNIFQRALFKKCGVYTPPKLEERGEDWVNFLKLTQTRKSMQDYLTGIGGYWSRDGRYPLEWNTSTCPDLDLEDFQKWLDENNEFSFEVADAKRRGFDVEVFEEHKNDLWDWGVEDAARTLYDTDVYHTTRFSDKVFPWKGWSLGRSGKHFCLEQLDGYDLKGMDEDEFEEFVKGLSSTELLNMFMICYELSLCLTSEHIDKEVQYQAFWRLGTEIERLYEERNIGKYEIVEGFVYHDVQYYRVRNNENGEESMLGTRKECEKLIELAEAGELRGSFGARIPESEE